MAFQHLIGLHGFEEVLFSPIFWLLQLLADCLKLSELNPVVGMLPAVKILIREWSLILIDVFLEIPFVSKIIELASPSKHIDLIVGSCLIVNLELGAELDLGAFVNDGGIVLLADNALQRILIYGCFFLTVFEASLADEVDEVEVLLFKGHVVVFDELECYFLGLEGFIGDGLVECRYFVLYVLHVQLETGLEVVCFQKNLVEVGQEELAGVDKAVIYVLGPERMDHKHATGKLCFFLKDSLCELFDF